MTLLELCDPEPATVRLEASVAEAIRVMLNRHVGAVGILDEEGRVAGIFTERDVLMKMSLSGRDPANTPVRELMSTPVVLASLSTGPGEAMATMVERHYRHLPVADDNGKLLGILPYETCWSRGSTISARNWIRWSSTLRMTGPAAKVLFPLQIGLFMSVILGGCEPANGPCGHYLVFNLQAR